MGAYHSMCRSEIGRLRAIFIAPTETLVFLPFTFIGRHSLSLAFARQLPQRGSQERLRGAGAIHRGTCETVGVRAIFIAPTETLIFLPFTFIGGHSLSLASLDSSLREGAGNGCGERVPFIGVLAKPEGYGRFSSPLRNSEDFGFHHSSEGEGAQNKTPLRGVLGGDLIAPSGSGWRSGFGRWCCR